MTLQPGLLIQESHRSQTQFQLFVRHLYLDSHWQIKTQNVQN